MLSNYILPILIVFILIYGLIHKKNIYDSFLNGVKDGLYLFIQIYPTLLAMSFAINLLNDSNLLFSISRTISHFISFLPTDIIPMVLFRPFSGSTTLLILVNIYKNYGVDSFISILGSVIQGSTDTTLYVISLYFAHVNIKNIKNSLWIGLFADFIGITSAIILTYAFFS